MFVIYTISASVQDVAEGNRRESKARLGPRNLKNCRAVPGVRSRRGDLPCKTFLVDAKKCRSFGWDAELQSLGAIPKNSYIRMVPQISSDVNNQSTQDGGKDASGKQFSVEQGAEDENGVPETMDEAGNLQETTDANGDIMEVDKGENTFVNMEAGASDVSGGTDESNDVLPKAVVLKGNYSETYQNKLQNVYEQIIPLGYKPTEHSLNRILGRMKQGKFDSLQDVIDTLQTGTKYWDPEYGGYVMYKNEISIHITEDGIITTVIGKAKIKDTWEEVK
ncbi:hypothetical protein [Beduinella massiliensis]|uniref:hypothetical protein n=1 Tax=Beduinella massiliensis TaxID=1852363 RepID=UPI000C8192EE